MLTGTEILFALSVAVFSITVTWLLTDEGMIFEKPFLWLRKHLENTWLWYPLGGCPKCFAGQVMFWVYFINNPLFTWKIKLVESFSIDRVIVFEYGNFISYDPIKHFLITTWAIFFTWLFMRLYTKYNTNNDNTN